MWIKSKYSPLLLLKSMKWSVSESTKKHTYEIYKKKKRKRAIFIKLISCYCILCFRETKIHCSIHLFYYWSNFVIHNLYMHYFPLWHKIRTHLIICLMTFYFSIAFNSPCHWAVLVTGSHVGFEPQTVFADNLLVQTAPPHPEAATLEPFLLAVGGLDFGCWTWRKLWFLVRVDPSTSWFTVNPPTPWATELDALVSLLMSLFSLFLETLDKNKKLQKRVEPPTSCTTVGLPSPWAAAPQGVTLPDSGSALPICRRSPVFFSHSSSLERKSCLLKK